MRITLLCFGVLKDLLRPAATEMDLPDGTTVAHLLEILRRQTSNPGMSGNGAVSPDIDERVWRSLAVAVNREYATATHVLRTGDEVALLPPVSGGAVSGGSAGPGTIAIIDQPIDTTAITAALKQGSDGALCLFDGIVRDNTRGRRTLYLDYEAYREMALVKMHALAAEATTRFAVREVAIVHRLGRLHIGETSVFIAVASAHRGAAFDACRFVIDTLKKTVPIWKKETFADGAVWTDGEPFPDELMPLATSSVATGSAER